ncbi:SDR family NAD(P)-dependent oxidoreductase [Nostoc sp. CHAB 5715]|uniref:SDR family NAD(P)-dependent oxidoreductase n=1 Tax=Nostoc sp. CHAB 5715 TaxID=2780400 RepID=UPI001E495C52|nr:SDR family NAD(P)-dependent oxidoreductase [Nostoc sp. CHAB 5715]MCC5624268.1 SDR family NAD(P)-dependent oxidoreductase [Nostoc sp. CHAB 5715]
MSNVTGTWITAKQATDPSYWVKHLCQTVRFASGVQELWKKDNPILLEVGPGQALSSFALQCIESDDRAASLILPSLRHSYEQQSDVAFLLNTLARLWLAGVKVDWSSFYATEQRYRIPLPTYPFERQRYWIDANPEAALATLSQQTLQKKPNIADWFYIPSWKRSDYKALKSKQKLCWLVFVDATGVGSQIAKKLNTEGHEVITVTVGQQFTKLDDCVYAINPQASCEYDALLKELDSLDLKPNAIAHFWSFIPNEQGESSHQFFEECQNNGFYSLLFLAQALGKQEVTDAVQILVVTNNVQEVNGDEKLCPGKAPVMGICKVIPQEYPNITCRNIDVVIPESGTRQENQLIDQLLAELTQTASENMVAYRGKHRWVQTFEPIHLEEPDERKIPIREAGVYLITGGLGEIGLVLAEYLAQTAHAKLILTGRSGLPAKQEWSQWLATHDENDEISRKIKKVQALEALGAEVLICRANIANLEQMQAVMTEASKRFGQVHGVIHAAGIKLFRTVQQISKTECESQLSSTSYGLVVLENVLQRKELDFCVIISSLASVLGVLGMAAYPAAYIFKDAFVHKHNQTSLVPWLSINYDDWITQESSVSVNVPKGEDLMMTRQEGLEVFKRALSTGMTQVVTSTVDLQASIKRWVKLEFNKDSQPQEKASSSSFYSRPDLDNAYVAPKNEIEQTIANIWQELLGIEQIGIHDNFFELGGDSVLGIQVSARAAKAGFRLTPQQLFEQQTIAKLAEVISTTQVVQAEQDLVTGPVPLTPIQHWFFEHNQPEPHYWNQSVLLETLQVINPALFEQALRQILIHHDALRLRFIPSESGWQQVNANPEEVVPFTHIDLSALSDEVQKSVMEATATQLQASLNLSKGPTVRSVLFELGVNKSSRLLIVIHHLVIDDTSWRVLLEDLETAYQQLSQGKAIQLPQKSNSFKQWSLQLKEHAHSTKLQKSQNYWLSERRNQVCRLPIDYFGGVNTFGSVQIVSAVLNAQDTQALLQEVPAIYRTSTQEVLLTALVQAFTEWTGVNLLQVTLEANGRDEATGNIDNLDTSRTVGWLTILYPVLLDLEKAENPGDALKIVKEQLRRISNEGVDYGVLRYLSEDAKIIDKIRALPKPEVMFLYLGQFDKSLPQFSLFKQAEESSGLGMSPRTTFSHLLHMYVRVAKDQLQMEWHYSSNVHRRETIEKLSHNFVKALQYLINHCQSTETGEYTPSDFSLANISQENLSKLLAQVGQSDRKNFS